MTKIEKPPTELVKQRGNAIWKYLWENPRFCTKQELMEASGCTNERVVRDLINILRNKGYCIVSVSNKRGYYLARGKADADIVRHAWQEVDSRIEELENMKKSLIKFHDKYGVS